MGRIADLIKERYGSDAIALTIFKSDDAAVAEEFAERVKSELNVQSIGYTNIGAVIGAHTGPGTTGVLIHRV